MVRAIEILVLVLLLWILTHKHFRFIYFDNIGSSTRTLTRIAVCALSMCMMICGNITSVAEAKFSFDLEQAQGDILPFESHEADDELGIFSEIADVDFYLSSGVGAWGTSLRIKADGTFTGDFHDTDMGDSGEKYPSGTMYSCEFSGKFMNPQKIDDYTYSFEMDYLNDESPREEFIDDYGVRIVPTEPCGLEIGKAYILYLPGTEMNTLPEEFVRWVSTPMAWPSDENPTLLPFYGIYNVDGQYGFSGSKNDSTETYGEFDDGHLLLTFVGIALLACGVSLFRKKGTK